MPTRLAFLLLAAALALLVCASSIWLVPYGQGPFSAFYGPASMLLASRVAARLSASIGARLLLLRLTAAAGPSVGSADPGHALPAFDLASLICVLNC